MIGTVEMTTRKTKQSAPVDPAIAERHAARAAARAERHRAASAKAGAKYEAELSRQAEREQERQSQTDGLDWLEGRDTEGARRFAALVDQKKSAVKASRVDVPSVSSKPMRAVRKAEVKGEQDIHARIRSGEIVREKDDPAIDPGTGQTIIKHRVKAIPKLVDDKKIGTIELQCAVDIATAFTAISSGLMCRGINYDRVDGGRGSDAAWPVRIARAVHRYQAFAKVWTRRNLDYGDPTLEILISAIVDERTINSLSVDHTCDPKRIEKALIGGLRDYAARAGFVTGHQAEAWSREAEAVFGPSSPELRRAERRAAVER